MAVDARRDPLAALRRPLPPRPPVRALERLIPLPTLAAAAFFGGILSGVVHALITVSITSAMTAAAAGTGTPPPTAGSSIGYGLCGERRCSAPEARLRRRKPSEPDVAPPKILEAALVPQLGMKQQDLRKLPELQAYEQREIAEDGVNLRKDNVVPPEPLKKRFRARNARRDRKKKSLRNLLDHVDEDPRKRVRSVADMVGVSDGEVDGEGTLRRPGNRYVKRVRRMLERDFTVPTHISGTDLAELRVRIKVQRMGPDGAILKYKIIHKSGNRGFDDAVLRLLLQFIPEEKGKKRLPVPDADVLRYINLKGLKIDLLGARLN